MFSIIRKGAHDGDVHLESETVVTPQDFQRIADELGSPPIRARKIGYVAARQATRDEAIETHSNGRETTNTAHAGDFIVTNLSPRREPLRDRDGHLNLYVIEAARFANLYEPTGWAGPHGAIHRARGIVLAIRLPGGFAIAAPWGERQTAASGYLLCNGTEVYGAAADAFDETYEILRN